MAAWHQAEPDGTLVLALHIQPGAKRSGVAGEHGDALKIRLAAPAVDGKANQNLIEFLAGLLDVPRSAVTIRSGLTSRRKHVTVAGAAARVGRLTAAAGP